jgi:glycosyltransferase involved in cell wall biosynthesis
MLTSTEKPGHRENAQGKISAVLITYNVADTIGACLAQLLKVADEVIVIDSFSNDGTAEICREQGVRLVPQEFLGFAQTKNLGNSFARNNWILSIDADEVLSPELLASLQSLPLPEAAGGEEPPVFALDRLTSFCGQFIRHGGWYPEWKPRLFDRRFVHWEGKFVHETLRLPPGTRIVKLPGKLYHFSFKDLDDHLLRLEKYARLGAEERFEKGRKASWFDLWLKPVFKFIMVYLCKMGFLDGKAGWVIARRSAWAVRRRALLLKGLWEKPAT